MNVGSQIQLRQTTWSFADSIEHFDTHILQSVPDCQAQREYIAALARFFLHQGACVYELGVSTGSLAATILAHIPERTLQYIGLDLEPGMVQRAQQRLAADPRFQALEAEASTFSYQPATLVIAYYTLQFIPLSSRRELLKKLWQTLLPGGALILYEKTLGDNAHIQDILAQLYADFKIQQGLDTEAVYNKAVSLRGVSQPLTLKQNLELLQEAGFQSVEIIYRAYCFAGFLACKDVFSSQQGLLAHSSVQETCE